MAWTAPKTWVVGEVLTAANLNLQLRDNFLALRGSTLVSGVPVNNGWLTPAAIVLDDLGGWPAGVGYFTAPYAGRFGAVCFASWSGASGGGTFWTKVSHFDSTGATLRADIAAADSAILNGRVTVAGMANMAAGERLYFGAAWGATGTAGGVTLRVVVEGRG
jgi:hypothetical protein